MADEPKDDNTQAAPSSAQGDPLAAPTPEPTPTEAPPKPDEGFRDDIVEKLMAGKEPTVEYEDGREKPPTPEKKPAAAPPSTPKQVELPKVPHPYDDADDPDPEQFVDPQYTKIRENVGKLRDKLRDAREKGRFGETMVKVAQTGGLGPEQMAWWVNLGARANKGDPQAISELAAVAQKLGITPPAPAAPAPQVPDEEATAKAIYESHFKPQVDALEITDSVAKSLAKKLAAERIKSAPAQAPAPRQAPITPPTYQPQSAPAPSQPAPNPSLQDLEKLENQYRQVLGKDYDSDVREKALQIVSQKAQKGGPIPPIRWTYEWSQAVNEVMRQRAGVTTKRVAPTEGLRPGRAQSPDAGEKDYRKGIVDALVQGRVDEL